MLIKAKGVVITIQKTPKMTEGATEDFPWKFDQEVIRKRGAEAILGRKNHVCTNRVVCKSVTMRELKIIPYRL